MNLKNLSDDELISLYKKTDNEIAEFNSKQLAIKTMLNSAYGATANQYFRYYDINHAEAITLSGQLSIQFIAKRLNEWINKKLNTKDVDYIIAIDTDSVYIAFSSFVEKYQGSETDKAKIIDWIDTFSSKEIEPFIHESYEDLANVTNAFKNAMKMKREAIGDKAIWTAKKHYMINVWDNEGIRYKEPDLKMMGIETVRSSTPEICREALKKTISIIMNDGEIEMQKYITEFKKQFFESPFEEIGFPRSANGLAKYKDEASIYKLGTPVQVKGSLLYNNLLKQRKDKKHIPIYDGDKIKFAYLKVPNPVKNEVIACPGYLPFEDVAKHIDYPKQFEIAFLGPLESILEPINWSTKKKASLKGAF